jgi:hypothetical protein
MYATYIIGFSIIIDSLSYLAFSKHSNAKPRQTGENNLVLK